MRISYSILKKISDGDLQGALEMMAGLEMVPTEKMIKGKELHKKIENSFPLTIGDTDSVNWEEKIEIQIGKNTLVGVIDFYDRHTEILVDWKYTSRKIYELDEMQLYVYSLLKPEAEFGILAKINDKCEVLEFYGKPLNERTRNKAKKWIEEQIKILEDAVNEKAS